MSWRMFWRAGCGLCRSEKQARNNGAGAGRCGGGQICFHPGGRICMGRNSSCAGRETWRSLIRTGYLRLVFRMRGGPPVKLGTAKPPAPLQKKAGEDFRARQREKRPTSPRRSRAAAGALKRESHKAASRQALSKQAQNVSRKASPSPSGGAGRAHQEGSLRARSFRLTTRSFHRKRCKTTKEDRKHEAEFVRRSLPRATPGSI
jgi:hypothetical protein